MQPKNSLKALALAMAIAAPMEGIRYYAYKDPVGILTVCRGHTGSDIIPGKKYSLAECDGLFSKDMKLAVDAVRVRWPDLPDGPTAAVADGYFNIGPKFINPKTSTLARLLDAGNITAACGQFSRWTKARVAGILVTLPGLVTRAKLRTEVCLQT